MNLEMRGRWIDQYVDQIHESSPTATDDELTVLFMIVVHTAVASVR